MEGLTELTASAGNDHRKGICARGSTRMCVAAIPALTRRQGYPAPTSSAAKSRACPGVDVFQQYLSGKLIVGYTSLHGNAVQCLFIGGGELGTGGAVCAGYPGAAISCDVRGYHLPDVV